MQFKDVQSTSVVWGNIIFKNGPFGIYCTLSGAGRKKTRVLVDVTVFSFYL